MNRRLDAFGDWIVGEASPKASDKLRLADAKQCGE
jgi:hypothetical protein